MSEERGEGERGGGGEGKHTSNRDVDVGAGP